MKKYGAGLKHTFPWQRACEHGDDKSKDSTISRRTALWLAWARGEYLDSFDITKAGYRPCASLLSSASESTKEQSKGLQNSGLPKLPPCYDASDPKHAEI